LTLATIRDVARAAGVSIATVSRVYADSAAVSEESSRRVLEAGARLDYWPNAAARSLTMSRTGTLGVLLPDIHGEFFSEVIRGIDSAAREQRLQVIVSGSHAHADALVSIGRSLRGRVDGLIVMAPDEASSLVVGQLDRSFPIVLLNGPAGCDRCDTISIANFEGAHTLVRHLLSLGHRRIAIILGPSGNVDAEDRRQGYRAALREAGLEPDPTLEFAGDFSESSGYVAADALLRHPSSVDAVFATNDCMAIGLLSALQDRGARVPADVALAGFDDIAVARYLNPPLTTVRVDAFQLGQRAVSLWLTHRHDRSPERGPVREVLPVKLVVRGSCGWRPSVGASESDSLPLHRERAIPSRWRSGAMPATAGQQSPPPGLPAA
jgi:LacI family transcriptional regulator